MFCFLSIIEAKIRYSSAKTEEGSAEELRRVTL